MKCQRFMVTKTLQSLLEHSKDMLDFLKKYEDIYSFTQPDLEEQLLSASADMEDDDEEKASQT